MNLEIKQPYIYRDSIAPAISFSVNIVSSYNIEYPYMITGELLCGGKVVSFLQPLLENRNEFEIRDILNAEDDKNYREKIKNYFSLMLIAELDEKKIDFIENERQKNVSKSVVMSIRLRIGGIRIPTNENMSKFRYKIKVEELSESIEISQNDWLQRFSPYLGIGEFYLVELIKPEPKSSNNIWSDLYETLVKNLNQMEEELKKGDWQRTMEISRRFFENIKIGDKKKGHEKYKEELKKRMQELQFDEEGINNLFDGIWQFFEFTSKFIHEKGKEGNAKPIPNAKKEDAYFVYSLSVNLTNLIYEKIKTSS